MHRTNIPDTPILNHNNDDDIYTQHQHKKQIPGSKFEHNKPDNN